MALGKIPMFVWQCTLSDAVAPLLEQFVLFGLAAGVKKFTFGNLIEFKPVPNAVNVAHPAKMPTEELVAFRSQFKRLLAALAQNGVAHEVQPGIMEGIDEALRARGVALDQDAQTGAQS
jgi:hypothetical protein